jgi:hypothetical protein
LRGIRPGFLAGVCALFFIVRIHEVRQPWVNLLETGFQEAIALHHMGGKVLSNHFLPVIAEMDGVKYFHTAHPPLLHLIYAGLYSIAGVHEWVSRIFSMILYLATVGLWYRYLLGERRSPFFFFPLALFFPVAFALCRTTNYEPLSLFLITLIASAFFQYQRKRNLRRLALLVLSLTLAMLSDWPAYLAVPALIILNIRKPLERRVLFTLLLYEAMFLAALLIYQKTFAGEAAFFGHAIVRSDPRALLRLETYQLIAAHLSGLAGFWVLILFSIFILGWGREWLRSRTSPLPGLNFFLVFAILLFLSAPQLVAKHYVHLFYLAPAMIFLSYSAIRNSAQPAVLLIASLILFLPTCYKHIHSQNYRYYHASQALAGHLPIRSAFFSPAIGTFHYYNGVETLHPVGRIAEKAFFEKSFDLVVLERKNPEVARLVEGFSDRADQYRKAIVYPDEVYYLKNRIPFSRPYLAASMEWPRVFSRWWQARPAAVSRGGEACYAIYQAPGPGKISRIKAEVPGGRRGLEFSLSVQHELPLPFSGDGASFMVIAEQGDRATLNFFRYVPDSSSAGEFRINLNFRGPSALYLITEAGPRANYNFDDAYWLEARWESLGGGE